MAIIINDNFAVNVGKPIDAKYLNGQTPWVSISAANAGIPLAYRYTGLTVNINGTEYWYASGVSNPSLIQKKYDSIIPSGSFVTGATNIGYFSGLTGIQKLPLYDFPNPNYNGNYCSIYNYYFRGTDCKVHVGTPSDGISKRGYVKTELPVKSWLWNNPNDFCQGWILVDGNIASQIGQVEAGVSYYSVPTTYPYTASTWTALCNNGSCVAIGTPLGSLNTGSTITIGGPVYATKTNNNLNLRTLQTKTPGILSITNDEAFVYFSGVTPVTLGTNVGVGVDVFKSLTGTTMQFRRIQGSGNTVVSQVGDSIIVTTIVTGSTSGVTNAVNIGTGTGVFNAKVGNLLQMRSLASSGGTSISTDGSTITIGSCDTTAANIGTGCGIFTSKSGCCIQLKSLKGSGSTSISAIGSDLVIYSSGGSGGGTYNCASPSICPTGGMCAGTVLTGKTAFEILREILVPELCGTITAPSIGIGLTASGLYEIGCTLSQTVTGTFSRGSISPQYCSPSPFRSGCANAYSFTGCGMPSGFQACALSSASETNASYTVVISTQSWGVCTRYAAGSCAQGNAGTVYCAALPSGSTSAASGSIVGVYPLYATTSTITTLTKQALQNMSTANNIQINLVADSNPNKQKFEIPCAWLGSRPLFGVCQWNTASNVWEYPGGCAACSLVIWTPSASSETVQGNPIGYCQYTYNSVDRSSVCIRLVF